MITIEIAKIVLCITLFLESIIDIKKKQVWIGFPVSASAVGVFCDNGRYTVFARVGIELGDYNNFGNNQ